MFSAHLCDIVQELLEGSHESHFLASTCPQSCDCFAGLASSLAKVVLPEVVEPTLMALTFAPVDLDCLHVRFQFLARQIEFHFFNLEASSSVLAVPLTTKSVQVTLCFMLSWKHLASVKEKSFFFSCSKFCRSKRSATSASMNFLVNPTRASSATPWSFARLMHQVHMAHTALISSTRFFSQCRRIRGIFMEAVLCDLQDVIPKRFVGPGLKSRQQLPVGEGVFMPLDSLSAVSADKLQHFKHRTMAGWAHQIQS